MTIKEQAELLDTQERPVEAAEAYERAIAEEDATLDLYLNLAVLYFVCTDFGYQAYHHLSDEFIAKAWDRAFKLLDEAESRFGPDSEITFWRRYFRFVRLGDDPFIEECERLALSGSLLVPYFYLFGYTGEEKHREQAQKLYESVKNGSTEKQRYIRSILENRLKPTNLHQRK
jgi:hypothetical protein